MTTDKTYNGWTNYETWCVNTWLTDEQESSNDLYVLANDKREGLGAKAEMLQSDVRELYHDLFDKNSDAAPLGTAHGMLQDLLGSALDNVNWREIIQSHCYIKQNNQAR